MTGLCFTYRFGSINLEGQGDVLGGLGLAEPALGPLGRKRLGYWEGRKEGGREGWRERNSVRF